MISDKLIGHLVWSVSRFLLADYFHVWDKSGLSCGLLMKMLPYLPTTLMTENASNKGSMISLLKFTNALPSIRPCK